MRKESIPLLERFRINNKIIIKNIIFHIIVIFVIICFAFTMVEFDLSQSLENNTCKELSTSLSLQEPTFENNLENQYSAIRLVADMLANGRHFTSEKIQPTLNSIFRTFHLSTLAYVDVNGKTQGCIGYDIGDISDLSCFKKIVNEEVSEYSEFISGGVKLLELFLHYLPMIKKVL